MSPSNATQSQCAGLHDRTSLATNFGRHLTTLSSPPQVCSRKINVQHGRATFGNFHFRKRTLRGRAMQPQRTNRSQASVKVVAVLRTWGRSVNGARTILPFPDCVKHQPQRANNPARPRRDATSYPHPPSAPCSEAWRNVAAVFRPPERVLERALPALTPAEAGFRAPPPSI
jgi:hypothetical protein